MVYESEDILAKKCIMQKKEKKKLILGIDEAGRGPVLGYLVYAGMVYYEDNDNKILQSFRDSKIMKPDSRKKIMTEIDNADDIGYVIYAVHPKTISYNMISQNKNIKKSLNEISLKAIQNIITTVEAEFADFGEISTIYIDALGNTKTAIDQLNEWHSDTFNRSPKYIIESKADSTYKIVSGASIVAKVTRDMLLYDYLHNNEQTDLEYNSGYPADPKTQEWLRKNFDHISGYPDVVRFSWNTVKDIINSYTEDDDSPLVSGYKTIKY